MPRYLWLRIGIVLAVIVGSARPAGPARLARPAPPADQPRAGPPGRASTWSSAWTSRRASRTCSTAWPATSGRRSRRRASAPRSRARAARGSPSSSGPAAGVPAGPAGAGQLRRVRHAVARTAAAGRIELALKEKVLAERRDSFVRPGAQGDPEPRRPVRRGGADDPEAGRQPHPRPAARRPGPRPGEGPHRQDGGAGVQAGGRPGADVARAVQEGPPAGRRGPVRPARGPHDQDRDAGPLRGQEGDAPDRRPHLRRRGPRLRRRGALRVRRPSTASGPACSAMRPRRTSARRSPSSSTGTSTRPR